MNSETLEWNSLIWRAAYRSERNWGIVIDLNLERLFFILTAAFFAFAVVRTLGLLFS